MNPDATALPSVFFISMEAQMSGTEGSSLDRTRALWERARTVMPGGVNASARMNPALGHPLFMQRGEGAYLFDVDGNRYIDYCVSHGASLLGHGHPAITAAVDQALEAGGRWPTKLSCRSRWPSARLRSSPAWTWCGIPAPARRPPGTPRVWPERTPENTAS